MGKQPELIELTQDCLHVTDDAILIISDFKEKVWLAKSILKGYTVNDRITPWEVEFTIPYWLAEKKGLI